MLVASARRFQWCEFGVCEVGHHASLDAAVVDVDENSDRSRPVSAARQWVAVGSPADQAVDAQAAPRVVGDLTRGAHRPEELAYQTTQDTVGEAVGQAPDQQRTVPPRYPATLRSPSPHPVFLGVNLRSTGAWKG